MTYRDLRTFLSAVEDRGKLYRFTDPINKDTELLPLFRVQLRGLAEADRKVMLFDQVTNAAGKHYPMGVLAGIYSVSEEITALSLGCESLKDAFEKWHQALENPIAPRLVDQGPVQQVVHLGDDLLRVGLDELPVPVEEPGFSQIIRTGLPMITRDPETGIRNVGTYNGFLRDRNRIVAGIEDVHDAMRYHWQTARRRNEDLPIAIVIGVTTNIMLVGCAGIPYGIDEMAVAGGLAGEPVELVPCKTIPLEVPAHAEIVIEGLLSTRVFEPRLGFGEYPGYIHPQSDHRPVITVTGITHREDALFTPIVVGFPPTDNGALSSFCSGAMLYHHLRYSARLPVEDVYFNQMGGGGDFCIIRLAEQAQGQAGQVLQAAASAAKRPKYFIAVDHDIDPRDPDLLVWALTYRVRPESDILIQPDRIAALDPSAEHTAHPGPAGPAAGSGQTYYRVLIDATMPGSYPPVALPRRDYMERALEIWRQHPDLAKPTLRQPWHSYLLGAWRREDQELADLIASGDYRAVGRISAGMQENL
jgi:UbiD family decarboxylase